MILGFGKIEQDFERKIIKKLSDIVKKYKINDYLDEKIVKEIKKEVKKIRDYYEKKEKEYKKNNNYPERYSTVFIDLMNDATKLCFVIKFFHHHTKHPLSPDGWVLLVVEKIVKIDLIDKKITIFKMDKTLNLE